MLEYATFKSQLENYQAPNPLSTNIRYSLSKKKIDDLFVRFMSMPQTSELVKKLTDEVKKNPDALLTGGLNAFITNVKVNLSASGTFNLNASSLKPNNQTPPKPSNEFGKHIKPNPSDSNDSSPQVSPRTIEIDKEVPSFLKEKPKPNEPNKDKFDFITQKEKEQKEREREKEKEREQREREEREIELQKKELERLQKEQEREKAMESLKDNKENIPKLDLHHTRDPIRKEEDLIDKEPVIKVGENIPKFYFPITDKTAQTETLLEIEDIFASYKPEELSVTQFELLTTKIFQVPKFLNSMVFARVDKDKKGKVTKTNFLKVWKNEYAELTPAVRCFMILKKNNSEYIEVDDLKPLMNILLEIHPGLEFLKATPEFQERYTDTVIQRIFYGVDKNDDSRISKREFSRSNIFNALKHVDSEDDINKVRAYFSYEHFYVLYCKFWELDGDHDFIISKEEFSRYSGHALNKKVVDRIFDQVPRKFKCKTPGKMSYEDFIWFCLSEEDKTTDRSIEYWFKVLDLDQNDLITGYEMEHFYEEQRQRLEYLNHEPVYYEDIICQMNDMFKPEKEIIFRRENFKSHRQIAGIFFNCMTNLNKFVAYEQRDPFMIKNELQENPDFTEWDRFAQQEYIRLALEEENAENSGMLDSADLWDNDDGEKSKA